MLHDGLSINPNLDVKALAATFARTGRVAIPDFLVEGVATDLSSALRQRDDWLQMVNSGDKTLELSRGTRAAMTEAQNRQLDDAVYGAARYGFQYRYEAIRVPDDVTARVKSTDPLMRFATWFSSDEVLGLLRSITDMADIAFADAQATAYAPGDFLTAHDDAVVGKNRRAAYVMGLTPTWRPEWGGLLSFHEEDGRMTCWPPAFNRLHLFRVPQPHSVSEVSRAAAYRRYSITGWLRAERP